MSKPNTNRGSKSQSRNNRNKPNSRKTEQPTVNTPSQGGAYQAIQYDASNIFFNNLLGTRLTYGNGNFTNSQSPVMPGIMRLTSQLNVNSRTDMINVAATSVYTYVRHANSGRSNYESSDLMIYLIAMSEVFSALTSAIRAYGFANYFESRNLYGERIVSALGIDSSDLRSNLADYRYRINVLIHKIKAMAVPQAFNFFDERIAEFSNVYKDASGAFTQFIAVISNQWGEFDATTVGGGSIQFVTPAGNKLSDLLDLIDRMITTLRDNEDNNIISGDIMKAYGDNLFSLQPISEGFFLEPILDELFLAQLQNAHVIQDLAVSQVYQANNKLHQRTTVGTAFDGGIYEEDRLLNSQLENITPDLIFAFSKYQVVIGEAYEDPDELYLISGNSTVFNGMDIFTINPDQTEMSSVVIEQINDRNKGLADNYPFDVTSLTKFRNHPYVYITGNKDTYDISPVLPLGDMTHVAVLSKEDTMRMNDARFILAFQTKQMG